MDWKSLTFSYTKTNTMLCTFYRNGAWTPVESRTDDTLALSAFAGALHMESSASKVSRLSEARMARCVFSDRRKMHCVFAGLLSS